LHYLGAETARPVEERRRFTDRRHVYPDLLGSDVRARGRGLAWGLAFNEAELGGKVSSAAFRLGLLVETAGPRGEVVKVLPR
jgi:diaminobutyrate-2-oxoglutarate transaminase